MKQTLSKLHQQLIKFKKQCIGFFKEIKKVNDKI